MTKTSTRRRSLCELKTHDKILLKACFQAGGRRIPCPLVLDITKLDRNVKVKDAIDLISCDHRS